MVMLMEMVEKEEHMQEEMKVATPQMQMAFRYRTNPIEFDLL